VYRVLVGKPEGDGRNGKPWCRWGNNIKMDSKEVELEGVDRTCLGRDWEKLTGYFEQSTEKSCDVK
jgi:hypothetical protein